MISRLHSKKYAVVDLEATSTGTDAKIIQVGIVLVKDGQLLESYETDVNPHEQLSPKIQELTGITDEQLAKAPEFSQVAPKIYELLEDAIFVAHNVRFDANLLAEVLFFEGYELKIPLVDTVELAQVFYPTLDRHNLGYLATKLNLNLEEAHTALADARATAELFLKLQEKMINLPKITLKRILDLSDHLIYETGQVVREIYEQMPDHPLLDYEKVMDLVLVPVCMYKDSYKLSKDFGHNLALLGLDEREQQAAFAALVQQHLEDDKVNFIQAQAGIGKTYGYLLSLLANGQGRRLIIAPPTKILQNQIMQSEGRHISDLTHINFHSLKGCDNYIKLDTFWETLSRNDENRLVNRHKMQILVWLTETTTGDLEELNQKQINLTYFNELRHNGQVAKSSLFYDADFWLKSYRKSQVSQVIVTNQAYLLTRIEDDPSFLEGSILVIDEAQKLFLNLENLSRRVKEVEALRTEVQSKYSQSNTLLTKRILENLQFNLTALSEQAGQAPISLTQNQVQAIQQDLKELEKGFLPQLDTLFEEDYEEFWLTNEEQEDRLEPCLHAASLKLLNFAHLLPTTSKVFCISASLTISKRVDLPQLLGFNPEQVTFDLLPQMTDANQGIWLPTDLPAITSLSEAAYVAFLTEKILDLVELNQPLLILFTANKVLRQVSEGLTLAGITHLAQGQNGTASHLKRRFERGERQILLGSGSFWEGVDLANPSKVLLVLTRLPFDNPEDKFIQKVNKRLKEEGKNPFYDYQLPLTILKIQQAIGRTRRNQMQTSAVILLDNRLLTKAYGKKVQRTLKTISRLTEETFEDSLSSIRKFLS